jgi:hypothetical protein
VWGSKHARVFGLFAVVLAVGSCGGSGYSKSDFVARADAICTKTLNQTRAVPPPSSAQSGDALAAYLAQVVPLVQSEADQLRALKRPPGSARDRATLNAYFAALGKVVDLYRHLETAAKQGDAQTVALLESTLRANSAAGYATSYGLSSCGSPGATTA